MAKHSTGLTYSSLWAEEDERAERTHVIARATPAHSTHVAYVPAYSHATGVRILPDAADGVATPMGTVPRGMPL